MVAANISGKPQAGRNGQEMTNDEFKIFRDLIHKECGIFLNDAKKDFLRVRIEKRMNAANKGSFYQYYKFITGENKDELLKFLDSVTINETYFFRNVPQFDLLREKVLPELIDLKRRHRDYTLSIWSAGCSSGEEPYSIAMELSEAIPDASLWNIKIIASDISFRCLELAAAGRYNQEKLSDVPEKYLSRWFKQDGDYYAVKDCIKKYVVFDYHNLQHENGMKDFDIIFCRNVMIYFNEEQQKHVVRRFTGSLNKGGFLFLGHAESLQGLTTNGEFKFHYWNKGTAYQKVAELHE